MSITDWLIPTAMTCENCIVKATCQINYPNRYNCEILSKIPADYYVNRNRIKYLIEMGLLEEAKKQSIMLEKILQKGKENGREM